MCIWVILVVTFYSITHFIVLYVCGSLKVLELKDWSCQQPFLNANMRMCTLDKVVSGLYFDMVCQVRLGFDQCDRNSVIKQGLSSVCVCVCQHKGPRGCGDRMVLMVEGHVVRFARLALATTRSFRVGCLFLQPCGPTWTHTHLSC